MRRHYRRRWRWRSCRLDSLWRRPLAPLLLPTNVTAHFMLRPELPFLSPVKLNQSAVVKLALQAEHSAESFELDAQTPRCRRWSPAEPRHHFCRVVRSQSVPCPSSLSVGLCERYFRACRSLSQQRSTQVHQVYAIPQEEALVDQPRPVVGCMSYVVTGLLPPRLHV